MFPFTIGDELTATQADLLASINRKELTAGENIDASSAPLAVYLKASDGKVYLTDTDADESTFKFFGFVGQAQNVLANASVVVTTGGILDGFTGMTAGNRMYLGATGGVLGTSPISNQGVEIGFAVSATQLFIFPQQEKKVSGTDSTPSDTTTDNNVQTIGFRPRTIFFMINAQDITPDLGRSIGWWHEGTYYALNDSLNGNLVLSQTNAFQSGFADSSIAITFGSITATGFTITYTKGGIQSTTAEVYWLALG